MELALNTATVRQQWTLAQIIDGCARHGIRGISPWRDQVAQMGLFKAKKSIRENNLVVTGLCRGGFFPSHTAAGRQAAIEDNLKAIDQADAIGAPLIVLVCGAVPGQPLAESRKQITDGIAAVLPAAEKAGVKLAIR